MSNVAQPVPSMRPAARAHRPRPDRPAQILEAACRAIVARGFPATRIADIAREAGTSTGTIHYYFETRDEVLVGALKWASERIFARLDALAAEPRSEREKLAELLHRAVPHPGPARDEYVLWVELWVRVLHAPELLAECEELSSRWRAFFFAAVRRGTEAGEFDPVAEPDTVAERLLAVIDGLGFETVLGYRWASPEGMRARLLDFAAEQLRIPRAELERHADAAAARG
jgi:AcrR family transcriptional regulator